MRRSLLFAHNPLFSLSSFRLKAEKCDGAASQICKSWEMKIDLLIIFISHVLLILKCSHHYLTLTDSKSDCRMYHCIHSVAGQPIYIVGIQRWTTVESRLFLLLQSEWMPGGVVRKVVYKRKESEEWSCMTERKGNTTPPGKQKEVLCGLPSAHLMEDGAEGKQANLDSYWCIWQDSNLQSLTANSPSSYRVCQFRHRCIYERYNPTSGLK